MPLGSRRRTSVVWLAALLVGMVASMAVGPAALVRMHLLRPLWV